MKSKILVCNVGWMTRYQGLKGQPDDIVGGGKWVAENKHGHESCNFLSTPSGDVFGHFETIKGKVDRAVSIERLGAPEQAERVENIDVVWVATDPHGAGRRVIGYYLNATVYRERQEHSKRPTKQHGLDKVGSYMVSAKAANMRCLLLEERTIGLGRPPGWIGQANWWFPEDSDNPEVPAFIAKVRRLLATHKRASPQGKSIKKKLGGTTDPARNSLVEKAAIEVVEENYANYKVVSVEGDNVGWDLEVFSSSEAAAGGGPLFRVEVKGLSGSGLVVGVTPNEYKSIKKHIAGSFPSYRLAVVTSALDAPKLRVFLYDQKLGSWVDEGGGGSVPLKVSEKVAAILSLT